MIKIEKHIIVFYIFGGVGWIIHNGISIALLNYNFNIYLANFIGFLIVNQLLLLFHQKVTFSLRLEFKKKINFFQFNFMLALFSNLLIYILIKLNFSNLWLVLLISNFTIAFLSYLIARIIFFNKIY